MHTHSSPPLEGDMADAPSLFHQLSGLKVIFLLSRGAKWRRDVDSLISLSVPFDLLRHESSMLAEQIGIFSLLLLIFLRSVVDHTKLTRNGS